MMMTIDEDDRSTMMAMTMVTTMTAMMMMTTMMMLTMLLILMLILMFVSVSFCSTNFSRCVCFFVGYDCGHDDDWCDAEHHFFRQVSFCSKIHLQGDMLIVVSCCCGLVGGGGDSQRCKTMIICRVRVGLTCKPCAFPLPVPSVF